MKLPEVIKTHQLPTIPLYREGKARAFRYKAEIKTQPFEPNALGNISAADFALQYQDNKAVIGIHEIQNGDVWDLARLETPRSAETKLQWRRFLTELVLSIAKLPESEVRHIQLSIDYLMSQEKKERVKFHSELIILVHLFRMKYSESISAFIMDNKK